MKVMTSFMQNMLVLAVALWGAATVAAPSSPLRWAELPDPSAQEFEDPFRDLSPEQFDDLQFALRLRSRLQLNIGSAEEKLKWQELLRETEEALVSDQIDIDWMLSQRAVVLQRREAAASAGNPALEDQIVTLEGFALPAPPDETGRPVAYLVPEPGMCSHLPPPPPNQMIRVLLTEDWTPGYDHEPVRLTGKLTIAPTRYDMNVVDGLVPMHATFKLDVETVEPLDDDHPLRAHAQTLAQRMRAAVHRKTGGAEPQN